MEIEPTDEKHEKNESIKPLEELINVGMIDVSDAETTEKEVPSDRIKEHPCSKCESKATWSSDIERHVKTNHEGMIDVSDAETTEKEAPSDRISRVTFPVPLSMNSLQKILCNKTVQEKSKITVHIHTMVSGVKITLHVHTMALALKPKVIFGVRFRTQVTECPISDPNHRVKTPEPRLRISEQCLNPDQRPT